MPGDCWSFFRETGDPVCYLIGRRLESGAVPEAKRPPERGAEEKPHRMEGEKGAARGVL